MSRPLQPDDPCYWMLSDPTIQSIPTIYKPGCYICEDPEFAMMGLPLCKKCNLCGGHVAADSTECDDCGFDTYYEFINEEGDVELT